MSLFRFASYIGKAASLYRVYSFKLVRNTAFLFLLAMFLIMYVTSGEETAIMDELAHIPAGYSYVKYADMRINPEHPPLLKDLSGLPLLFLDLKFPEQSRAWASELNGQWELGRLFLYQSGNNADRILFWARLGPMLLTILFGFLLFRFGEEWFGKRVALMALFLYAFSPALLAHGKYVTTDVAAAFGFFIGIAYFLRYLKEPSRRNFLAAGVAFGVAQALKFSLILLIPFLCGIAVLWALAHAHTLGEALRSAWRLLLKTVLVFAIGYAVIIWPLYQFHVWNYPAHPDAAAKQEIAQTSRYCPEMDMARIGPSQYRDTVCNLKTFRPHALADIIIWMSDKPLLRPFAQYAHGVLMVGQRTVGGNTTYFLGEVSRTAWWSYFPIVYLLKEPFALHALTLGALYILARSLLKRRRHVPAEPFFARAAAFTRDHFVQIAMLAFILFYWTVSIAANLNIGIRHIIPAFPFTFLLVSQIIIAYLRKKPAFAFDLSLETVKKLASFYKKKALQYTALFAVLVWYFVSVVVQYPYYIAYFNELAGGPKNGHRYVVDSNLDWGQDLKRLAAFVNENNIDRIRLDYFGGGSPEYYLKEKFIPWWSARGLEPGWFAVSASFRQGAFGTPIGNYERPGWDSYLWLRDKTPVTTVGHSIFVYKLD